jgi:sec-independent protein translocase protein TatA
MARLGPGQLLLILGVAFFIFYVVGPKNLPDIGKMLGSTMKEFRKGMVEFSEEMNAATVGGDTAQSSEPLQAAIGQGSTDVSEHSIEQLEALLEAKRIEAAAQAEQPVIDPDRKVARIVYEDEV